MAELRNILEHLHVAQEPSSSSEILPLLYDELRSLAGGYLTHQVAGQTLQPTALVHEAWLRLTREDARQWNDRSHFFRAAAQAMRHILVDRARAKARLKRGANIEFLEFEKVDLASVGEDRRVLLVDEALDRLEQENPKAAEIVTLRFFGGLTENQIAAIHGVTERTVRRQWSYAKMRLFQMLCEEV